MIVVAAATVVTGLRDQAVRSRATEARLLDLDRIAAQSDRLAWELLAARMSHSEFMGAVRETVTRAIRDVLALRRDHALDPQLERILQLGKGFWGELVREQTLIAAHQTARATTLVDTNVRSSASGMQAALGRLRAKYAGEAASADRRLYRGTIAALSGSGVLIALLAVAFVAGRRRAAAAERRALERSERRWRALVHKASEVVFVIDAQHRIRYVTAAVKTSLGHEPSALIGQPLETLVPPDQRERASVVLDRAMRDGSSDSPSVWPIPQADGSTKLFEAQSDNFLDDPDVGGFVVTIRDVTARREMEAQLRHHAVHDPLTGLANRTLFEDRVTQALQRVRRTAAVVSVLYVDITGFKAINESFGHRTGDELLRSVGSRIEESLRAGDTAARIGGDEFACLLEDLRDAEDALPVARRLLGALTQPITVGDRSLSLHVRLGLAHNNAPLITAEELIRNADLATYSGRTRASSGLGVFHEELLSVARRRLDLVEDLREALVNKQLTAHYQPLVELSTRNVVAVEALARWRHPREGLIAPDEFIPLAEESGLIVPLGRWMLDQALADFAPWSATAPNLRLQVNVAPCELLQGDYVEAVRAALARHAVAPDKLTLEVTESALGDDSEFTHRLGELADMGLAIAIDDFGTGASSLSRVQRLPIRQVKIDRAFLRDVDLNPRDATLVRSMIELGHALGLQMVVEGIEREAQLDALRTNPAPIGQGYLFGRPQAGPEIAEVLAGVQWPEWATPVTSR